MRLAGGLLLATLPAILLAFACWKWWIGGGARQLSGPRSYLLLSGFFVGSASLLMFYGSIFEMFDRFLPIPIRRILNGSNLPGVALSLLSLGSAAAGKGAGRLWLAGSMFLLFAYWLLSIRM